MAMEDFRVDVVIGKGPGATAIPLEIPPFTLVGATTRAGLLPGPAARPVRVHRPPGVLRARTSSTGSCTARPGLLGVDAHRRGRRRDRRRARAAPRASPTGCCAGSATTPRCAPTAWSPSTSRTRRPRPLRGRRARASTGSTGPCSTCCAGASAADRSASPRSRSPSGRSARPSRRSPSRSWCAPGFWRARRAAGSPPRPPGQHLGLRGAGRRAVRGGRRRSSTELSATGPEP